MVNTVHLTTLFFLASIWGGAVYGMPDEVDAAAVEKCQFLTHVKGNSGYGKNSGWQVIAKHHALKKAQETGATHLVWKDLRPLGAFNGEAIGQAYHCE